MFVVRLCPVLHLVIGQNTNDDIHAFAPWPQPDSWGNLGFLWQKVGRTMSPRQCLQPSLTSARSLCWMESGRTFAHQVPSAFFFQAGSRPAHLPSDSFRRFFFFPAFGFSRPLPYTACCPCLSLSFHPV